MQPLKNPKIFNFHFIYFSFQSVLSVYRRVPLLRHYQNQSCQGHNERVQLPQVQDRPRHLRRKVPESCGVSKSQGNFIFFLNCNV